MTTLNLKLQQNREVEYVVEYFAQRSKSSQEDIIAAFNLFEELTINPETLEKYSHSSYVMCRYMTPDTEDVISLLLWLPCNKGRCSFRRFKDTFRPDRFEYYYTQTVDVTKSAPNDVPLEGDASKDYYVFMRVCDKMLENLTSNMERKGIPDIYCIWRAYKLARKAHYGVCRASGEPYLTHPISVATILANMGIESHIIAAALLHDVSEDTNYTIKDISSECGEQIARYVDAVTSLHREYAKSHLSSEYSQDKVELDKRSFEKLVQAAHSDPRMVFALYIKAADRIHNLSTIDVMASEKQYDKVDETELDYLPLFREFKLNYFVVWIEDLTRKIANPEEYNKYKQGYESLYTKNLSHIDDMKQTLIAHLGDEFNQFYCRAIFDIDGYDCDITRRFYRPLEVISFVRNAVGPEALSPKMIDKRTVPTCDFDVILDGKDGKSTIDTFANIFVKMFAEKIAPSGKEITDFETDEHGRFIVKIEDRYRNVYRVCFCMRGDYISYNLGSHKGIFKEREDSVEQQNGTTIFVKLRNGKPMEIPKESTVLDLAFMIHEDIGICARSAFINDRHARISSILHDGDKVVIEADTERTGKKVTKFIPHARIAWLNFVKTRQARSKITRYLESQYEGDSSVTSLQDEALDNSHNRIWETETSHMKGLPEEE